MSAPIWGEQNALEQLVSKFSTRKISFRSYFKGVFYNETRKKDGNTIAEWENNLD